jgi:hypothetical protein
MFSFQDIKKQSETKFSKAHRDNFTKVAALQREKEVEDLENFDACPLPADEVFKHASDLNPEALKNILDDQFYNSNVINSISCISESLTMISSEWKTYIQSYFTNLKRIGEESAMGVAIKSDLSIPTTDTAKSLVVLKAPKDPQNANDLYHEVAVAMTTLNKLRSLIPNFACVYGYFHCGAPILDKAGNALSWCSSKSEVGYAIYENIENSHSMGELIKGDQLTLEEYLKYLVQFLYALKTAHEFCEFTHYDCHTGNILVKQLKNPMVIKYPDFMGTAATSGGSGDVFIKTDAILTFIDYGMTYVETSDGDKFGVDSFIENYSVFNDKPFILHDVFKFICFTLYNMRYSNDYKKIAKPLLSYFLILDPNETYDKFIKEGINYYYAAPYNNVTSSFNIDNFISYCLRLIRYFGYESPIVTPTDTDIILSCDYEKCYTLPEVLLNSGLDLTKDISPSTDLSTFLAVKNELDGNKLKKYLEDFIENYPYSRYNICVNKTIDLITQYRVILDDFPPQPDFDYMIIKKKNKDDALITYFSIYTKTKNLINELRLLLSLYSQIPSTDTLNVFLSDIDDEMLIYDNYYNNMVQYLEANLKQLRVDRETVINNINNNVIRIKRVMNSY